MRRVLQVAAFLLSGVATAGDAAAQASINAQTFRPAIGPENVITVEGTRTPGHLRPMAALWGEYARLPLRLQRSDGTIVADTVPDMATVHFMGGIGVTRYLSFALALPMVVYQGYDDRTPTALAAPAPPAFGIGDLRLVAKASLLRNQEGGFGLAFVPQFSFPTATPQQGSYRGDEAFTFEPRVAIDYKTARGMFLAANLSFLARTSSQQLFNVEVSHQFRYGLGAFAPIARGFGAGAEIIGAASIHNLRDIYAPLEGYLSGRWNHKSGLQVDLGGGAAFVNAVGSPQFRVFAGVG